MLVGSLRGPRSLWAILKSWTPSDPPLNRAMPCRIFSSGSDRGGRNREASTTPARDSMSHLGRIRFYLAVPATSCRLCRDNPRRCVSENIRASLSEVVVNVRDILRVGIMSHEYRHLPARLLTRDDRQFRQPSGPSFLNLSSGAVSP
jgi:hypothetical protein